MAALEPFRAPSRHAPQPIPSHSHIFTPRRSAAWKSRRQTRSISLNQHHASEQARALSSEPIQRRTISTGPPPSSSPTTPATAATCRSATSSPPEPSPAPPKPQPAASSNSPATALNPSPCPQAKPAPSSPTATRSSSAAPAKLPTTPHRPGRVPRHHPPRPPLSQSDRLNSRP